MHPIGVFARCWPIALANVSNARRFEGESVAAAAAIAEIAAIPELRETWCFNMISLHKYQYIEASVQCSVHALGATFMVKC